jgi:hypothetical protein
VKLSTSSSCTLGEPATFIELPPPQPVNKKYPQRMCGKHFLMMPPPITPEAYNRRSPAHLRDSGYLSRVNARAVALRCDGKFSAQSQGQAADGRALHTLPDAIERLVAYGLRLDDNEVRNEDSDNSQHHQ